MRSAVAERLAVTDGAVDPADGEVGVDRAGYDLEIVRPIGAPGDVRDLGLATLGDDQARMQPLGPAAQVDGLPFACSFLQPEHVHHPVDRLLGLRRNKLDMREL